MYTIIGILGAKLTSCTMNIITRQLMVPTTSHICYSLEQLDRLTFSLTEGKGTLSKCCLVRIGSQQIVEP